MLGISIGNDTRDHDRSNRPQSPYDLSCFIEPKGADLILPHQAAVAFDIGSEDHSELSFDGVRFQNPSPPQLGV